MQVSRRDIPGETKDAQKDRIQQQSKIKVVKMLALVVVLFVLSWLPLYTIFAVMKFGEHPGETAERNKHFPTNICGRLISGLGGTLDPRTEEFINIFTPIAQWLGSANSSINPILYAFNEKYRRGYIAIIQSRKCWGRLRYVQSKLTMNLFVSIGIQSAFDFFVCFEIAVRFCIF